MAGDLDGKAAVITGGASGIGRGIATKFAAEGATIVVADLHPEPREGGTPVVEAVTEMGVEAIYVECDVTNVEEIRAAIDAADEFGGIDILVNNAGIYHSKPFLDVTEEEYEQLLDVNLKGAFFAAQAAVEKMLEHERGGAIVNISSVAGLIGSANNSTYSASKGGVRLLTYALASEYGPSGIRVNAIHPGLIQTEMTTEDIQIFGTDAEEQIRGTVPLRRSGLPEDIAEGALYLASDRSSFVTGESLVIDGGSTYAR